jgi:hypothetical protein
MIPARWEDSDEPHPLRIARKPASFARSGPNALSRVAVVLGYVLAILGAIGERIFHTVRRVGIALVRANAENPRI